MRLLSSKEVYYLNGISVNENSQLCEGIVQMNASPKSTHRALLVANFTSNCYELRFFVIVLLSIFFELLNFRCVGGWTCCIIGFSFLVEIDGSLAISPGTATHPRVKS